MALLLGSLDDDEINGSNNADQILALTGNDVVVGGGGADVIDGSIGNDILYAASKALWRDADTDTVTGGEGDDIIYGAFGDILDGGTGFDRVNLDLSNATQGLDLDFRPTTIGVDVGLLDLLRVELSLGEGRLMGIEVVDRLIGTDFNDVFRMANAENLGSIVDAGRGDDIIKSMTGNNELYGGADNDILIAGRGNDKLDGGRGYDELTGGGGQDILTGGAGRDVFIFTQGDTSAVRSRADRITDFTQAQRDVIDVSRMDAIIGTEGVNDRFTFIGSDRFSGNAGELRFAHTSSSTFVSGDIDGDLTPDFQIELTGVIDLTAANFKL
jgi:Ca2+-binding RTX toxin-like protein